MSDPKKVAEQEEAERVNMRAWLTKAWLTDPDERERVFAQLDQADERARRWPQTSDGYVDKDAAMTVLARSFPVLVRDAAEGIHPWNVDRFLPWLCGPAPSLGAVHVGRFLLAVWRRWTNWSAVARDSGIEDPNEALGSFDVLEAVGIWDHGDTLAFMIWMEAPFWPQEPVT